MNNTVMVIVVAVFAYLVNTGSHFWMLSDYAASPVFGLTCSLSFVLFFGYSFVLVAVYILFFEHRNPLGTGMLRWKIAIAFLLLVVAPILIFHFMLLMLLFHTAGQSIWDTTFPSEGYPIFIVFVLLQYGALLLRPKWHAIYLPMTYLRSKMIAFAVDRKWDEPIETVSIAERVEKMVKDAKELQRDNAVSAQRVMLLCFTDLARCYTIDGIRFDLKKTSSILANLLVAGWFVEIRRGVWINMLYFEYSERGNRLSLLEGWDNVVLEDIAQREGVEVRRLLQISKDLKRKVVSCFEDIGSLPKDWEGQFIDFG